VKLRFGFSALLTAIAASVAGCSTVMNSSSTASLPAPTPSTAAPGACVAPLQVGTGSPTCGICGTCTNCPVEARYALAVTRPAVCNDFPVTYRVQVPETDPRVRNVERVTYR